MMVAALLIVTPLMIISDNTGNAANSSSSGEKVLFDMGNGDTIWSDISSMGTIDAVLRATANSNGLDYSSSGNTITVNEVTTKTIGAKASGGSLSKPGTTGKTETAGWIPYVWNTNDKQWAVVSDISLPYTGGYLALGFYPSGQVPTETPDNQSSWTMIMGDAQQSGAQSTTAVSSSDGTAQLSWVGRISGLGGVDAAVLSAQGYIFVKYNAAKAPGNAAFVCYTQSGTKVWEFDYPCMVNYELSTPIIVGNYVYVPATYGYIFKVPLIAGPGANNQNVTTFNGTQYGSLDIANREGAMPSSTGSLSGITYNVGPGSLIYDSGAIYCQSCNGMVYCFDLNLNLLWSSQMGGCGYFFSPTVYDNYIFTGALNGSVYVFDKANGQLIDQASVYNVNNRGSVQAVSVFEDNGEYTLIFGMSDGNGMNSMVGGIGVYTFDGSKLTKKVLITGPFGLVANYCLPINTNSFTGVYFTSVNGIFSVDTNGNYKLLNDLQGGAIPIKAPMLLINGNLIYIQGYSIGSPIYTALLDGTFQGEFALRGVKTADGTASILNYSMSPVLVIDGWIYSSNDSGINAIQGTFSSYAASSSDAGTPLIYYLAVLVLIILVILAVIYVLLRYVKGEDKPFNFLSKRVKHYLGGDDLKHNQRSKHRLKFVLSIGIIITVLVFLLSLCVGYHATMSLGTMFSSLFAAIAHGGADPSNFNQVAVFQSRLPRTIAAFAVGIGLSVAGCMYQAIIRNPLTDPYIMGVSSGAGTAAVAVIAFNFTFFGLFAPHSIYATAFTAMIGGLIAFAITMFIAERAGSSSINYVLAGVVVGLAFSSIQTLMLTMAGHSVSNALMWLFGSFANVSWNQVWLLLIPAVAMSLVPLLWAKEFNLVLLGEDQAQQMGLNVRRFNRIMLILASVLASLCVAFVGIIGFVGLVIPHLCRMMLGGDHRLVLPASIVFGGALMIIADLAARTLYLGLELPVGAITTMIGVPVFAYLLVRRGKMYEG